MTHYTRDEADKFLILACDGLWDDMSSDKSVEVVSTLMKQKYDGNYATSLITGALSGVGMGGPMDDMQRIQHHFSIPPPHCRRYRDDTTINVVLFDGVSPSGKSLARVDDHAPGKQPRLDSWVTKLKTYKIFNNKL